MKLILGLGNPGKRFEHTRHNIGFDCLDYYLLLNNGKFTEKKKFLGMLYETQEAIFLKPMTFMNLSGQSVKKVIKHYKIASEDIIVFYDDLDLDLGRIRLRERGSSGGHNGLKSLFAELGTQEIKRCKVGIGKSSGTIDHVLGHFTKKELTFIEPAIKTTTEIISGFIAGNNFADLMNTYNKKS
ncbi:MAG: aminoacyl-tRNA hydrolase [Erysipelotrichales bacterium]|nr:aminoacyl-tRNA hydrolase [Erysipelotrichales bacterium]